MAATSTRARRTVGSALNALRRAAGLSADEVGRYLGRSGPTVTRYESGEILPTKSVVRDLCQLYDASSEQRAEVLLFHEIAAEEPPPVKLPAGTPKAFRSHLAAEREALEADIVARTQVHGLFQIREYAKAHFAAAPHFNDPNTNIDSVINVRLARQERLEPSPDALRVDALFDEAVINQCIGGPKVMIKQLRHLLELMKRPNVNIRVILHKAGAYGPSSGGFTVLKFPEADAQPTGYIEYPGGGVTLEDPKTVRRFTASFDDASSLAESVDDTRKFIQQRIRALEQNESTQVLEE